MGSSGAGANGVFQMTVPNWTSWQSRLTGPAWLHLDVPRHLYHFTPPTLARLLNDNGFAIEKQTRFGWSTTGSALRKVCSTSCATETTCGSNA